MWWSWLHTEWYRSPERLAIKPRITQLGNGETWKEGLGKESGTSEVTQLLQMVCCSSEISIPKNTLIRIRATFVGPEKSSRGGGRVVYWIVFLHSRCQLDNPTYSQKLQQCWVSLRGQVSRRQVAGDGDLWHLWVYAVAVSFFAKGAMGKWFCDNSGKRYIAGSSQELDSKSPGSRCLSGWTTKHQI